MLTGFPAYTVPMFLLRPPSVQGLDWRFQPPDLEQPSSQLCTASQFKDAAFHEIVEAMRAQPGKRRGLWEQVWTVSMLATEGMVAPGRRGLGIETGSERISALLASRGVEVLATGSGASTPAAMEIRRVRLFYPEVVHIEDFDQLCRFAELDPRRVDSLPADGFDFCWSVGMPGRLHSIEAALDFLEASLAPLRPGGLAVHSFAFNLTSDQTTWEFPDLVILRRCDIEALAERLGKAGHRILTFNTHPGYDPADERVTTQPATTTGHRQRHGVVVSTSFGLAIRKAA